MKKLIIYILVLLPIVFGPVYIPDAKPKCELPTDLCYFTNLYCLTDNTFNICRSYKPVWVKGQAWINRALAGINAVLWKRIWYTCLFWLSGMALAVCSLFYMLYRATCRYKLFTGVLTDNYNTFKDRYLRLLDEISKKKLEEDELLQALEYQLRGFQSLLDKAYGTNKPQHFFHEFKEYAASLGREKTSFANLHYIINRRNHGLVRYLRATHPDLTDYELDMLCVLRFGFSFNGIRLLHGHDNIYSLYSRRTKIHRKLHLPPRYPLENYLAEVSEQLKNSHRL